MRRVEHSIEEKVLEEADVVKADLVDEPVIKTTRSGKKRSHEEDSFDPEKEKSPKRRRSTDESKTASFGEVQEKPIPTGLMLVPKAQIKQTETQMKQLEQRIQSQSAEIARLNHFATNKDMVTRAEAKRLIMERDYLTTRNEGLEAVRKQLLQTIEEKDAEANRLREQLKQKDREIEKLKLQIAAEGIKATKAAKATEKQMQVQLPPMPLHFVNPPAEQMFIQPPMQAMHPMIGYIPTTFMPGIRFFVPQAGVTPLPSLPGFSSAFPPKPE